MTIHRAVARSAEGLSEPIAGVYDVIDPTVAVEIPVLSVDCISKGDGYQSRSPQPGVLHRCSL